MVRTRLRVLSGMVAAAVLSTMLLVGAPTASFAVDTVTTGDIQTPDGPITRVFLSDDMKSQLRHITLGGAYYQPNAYPATNTGPYVVDSNQTILFSAAVSGALVSRDFGGAGTHADPYWISTTRAVSNTLTVTKKDSYTPGDDYIISELSYTNNSAASATVQMSYWVDCYLGGSDQGTQAVGNGSARCISPNGLNNIVFSGTTPDAHTVAGQYLQVENAAKTFGGLTDQCLGLGCTTAVDNGMAIGWTVTAAPGETVSRSYLATYTDAAGFADLAPNVTSTTTTADVGDQVPFTVTVQNNGPSAVTQGSATVVLPAGLTFASSNPAGTYNGTTGVWSFGQLNNGETATLTLTATATAAGTYSVGVTDATSELFDLSPCGPQTPAACGTAAEVVVAADPPAPAISLVKSVTPATVTAAGQTVNYSFLVTNTGNTVLTDAGVTEETFTGTGSVIAPVCPAEAASLAPGAAITCTLAYTVTQPDIDAGIISNAATSHGTPPGVTPAPVLSSASLATVTVAAAPAITLVKTVSPATLTTAGETVTYSFLVTNTGNDTLSNVGVTEGAFTGTGTLPAATCPTGAASLAPAAAVTCTADYTVTQADIDAGTITNTATAHGTPPGTAPAVTSAPSTATLSATSAPGIALTKTATPSQVTAAGQTIRYSFQVTNTGNTTLTDTGVTEGAFTGSGTLPAVTCPTGAASLAPGASVTCTTDYTITQADIDAGTVTNTATSHGTPPGTAPAVTSAASTATVTSSATSAITLAKSVTPATVTEAGDTVTYSFLATNTGGTTLNNVGITEDTFTGTGTLPAVTCPAGAASLAPGASVTCTTDYTITQADADAGTVTNTATAHGTPPGTAPAVTSAAATATLTVTPIPANPVITLAITASVTTVTTAGQEITYSYLVSNTGNVPVNNVTIPAGTFTGTGTLPAVTCPTAAASLEPGESVTCTATYRVTAADLTGTALTNTTTATATAPDISTVVSAPATASVQTQTPTPTPTPTPTAPATTTPVAGLAATGNDITAMSIGALLLLLLGATTHLIHNRRRTQ